ncbi:MAG: hypothetical protein ACHRXM_10805 [Isosphaerales bacterium]
MNDGKHCPACGKDIGIWPIFSAGLPNRIWCPHRKARLCYRGVVRLSLALVIIAVALATAPAYATIGFPPDRSFPLRLAAFGVTLLALWMPVELAVALYLRSNKVLSRVGAAY